MKATAILAAVLAWGCSPASAQQTIFNVPSADVLKRRALYLETDWYVRPWQTKDGRATTSSIRGVVGIGNGLETGLNFGAFDLVGQGSAFADAAIKWSPTSLQSEVAGLYGGSHVGLGLDGDPAGRARNLTYAGLFVRSPDQGMRVVVGPYFATRYVFGRARGGALASLEMKLKRVSGVTLAADWFSGDGGFATPGLIYSAQSFTWYAGYAFANRGRYGDLVALELGVTFSGQATPRSR